ncbi:bifunctional DNA-binding transcriptional regulator/O6-methylguanine-DNA methyltransferase Ada [Lichenicoccus sp.]|uniref:bifunctional DNA-binding transcriptional regulator/O6-methylguanine-DNA methyltransferase Ada n=1 Tax=Lichenicoccus sp. TaxID=2781899 RepID=UPI003D0DB2B9
MISYQAGVADEASWGRVLRRDKSADGLFWYSVVTTGVYCRPSCPSRQARRENVEFHETPEAARRAGFRPCRRCNPDAPPIEARHAALVTAACRAIEQAEGHHSLGQLAALAGMSPSHFHRLFRRATGLTPKAYAGARRAARLREALAGGSTVTAAIYEAGFGSSGRFYAGSDGILGMTPSRFRAGGTREELRFAIGQCSLGAILVASSARGVAAILLGDDPEALARELQDRFRSARLVGGDAEYERLVAQVVGLVEAPRTGLDLPLDVRGTAFQQLVWQALRQIPAGSTTTYTALAERIGAAGSARAVAGACAANALAVAIPCHRVVRQDGALAGYRWGVARKRRLLELERPDKPCAMTQQD